MDDKFYSKETMDAKLDLIHESVKNLIVTVEGLDRKVSYTNGKVRYLSKVLLIVGTATMTLLFTNGSDLANFFLQLIK